LGGFLRITRWAVSSLSLTNGTFIPQPHKKIKQTKNATQTPFPWPNFVPKVVSNNAMTSFYDLSLISRLKRRLPAPLRPRTQNHQGALPFQRAFGSFIQKKSWLPIPGNAAFSVCSGNPAIPRQTRDPWLSVARLLGVWLYHA
jgi:hypothetical protein